MKDWLFHARRLVAAIAADLPADATLTDRRRALREVGPRFHGGTWWGRRQWGKACREHLEKHGQKARVSVAEPTFAADIIFPWKKA